jgi:hypothetical protein
MRRRRRLPVAQVVLVTIGLGIALGLRPVSTREILAAYVLALTCIALVALAREAHVSHDWERSTSELERALAPRTTTRERPTELVRVERDVTLSVANAGELHTRLLPKLRDVATARLAVDRGVSFAHAREILGDDVWDLLRPDRPAPADRSAPGLPLARIADLVDTIERL